MPRSVDAILDSQMRLAPVPTGVRAFPRDWRTKTDAELSQHIKEMIEKGLRNTLSVRNRHHALHWLSIFANDEKRLRPLLRTLVSPDDFIEYLLNRNRGDKPDEPTIRALSVLFDTFVSENDPAFTKPLLSNKVFVDKLLDQISECDPSKLNKKEHIYLMTLGFLSFHVLRRIVLSAVQEQPKRAEVLGSLLQYHVKYVFALLSFALIHRYIVEDLCASVPCLEIYFCAYLMQSWDAIRMRTEKEVNPHGRRMEYTQAAIDTNFPKLASMYWLSRGKVKGELDMLNSMCSALSTCILLAPFQYIKEWKCVEILRFAGSLPEYVDFGFWELLGSLSQKRTEVGFDVPLLKQLLSDPDIKRGLSICLQKNEGGVIAATIISCGIQEVIELLRPFVRSMTLANVYVLLQHEVYRNYTGRMWTANMASNSAYSLNCLILEEYTRSYTCKVLRDVLEKQCLIEHLIRVIVDFTQHSACIVHVCKLLELCCSLFPKEVHTKMYKKLDKTICNLESIEDFRLALERIAEGAAYQGADAVQCSEAATSLHKTLSAVCEGRFDDIPIVDDLETDGFDCRNNKDRLACYYCNKPPAQDYKLRTCGGCKIRKYCSSECQLADWKIHKVECQKMQMQREEEKQQKGKEIVKCAPGDAIA